MKNRIPATCFLLSLLGAMAIASPEGSETAGFLPKDDLAVSAFLSENPEADGRGITVAVLDTGVDLLHPALQRTPDGSFKIVDFHDATDAGDVATTTMSGPGADGTLIGISGRRLRLPGGLPDKLRLGLVRSSEIYPRGLLRRLRNQRKEEREKQKRLATDRAAGGKAPAMPPDPGDPVHDLVLYAPGDGWRVLVDTDGDGDLAEEKPMREFPVAHEVQVLGAETRLGFGVRVKRNGRAVTLLFDGGGHGTHVAGIIAGFYGAGSPLNGLAPGARILAVKIGNGRYGGPTTHQALIRGLEYAGRHGADVVNISFGGPSLYGDGREIGAGFADEAVRKYGYAICLSAGNAGPAHATVGAPATSRRAFSIGAWCSAATQTSNYGVVHPKGDALFGFSSRGPLPSGAPGVDFIAPGAAVSTMPEWTLAGGRNMNGTSMASPQAAGAVAVLLSAAKHEGLAVTPNRLVAALRAGAKPVPGLTQVEQGYGLIQVGPALQALRTLAKGPEPVEWIVGRSTPAGRGAGYLDLACTGDEPQKFTVELKPDFGKKMPVDYRARFSRMLRLVPDAPWLSVASPVHASSKGATVGATVDPTKLSPGLNVGVIRVVDIETDREEGRIVATVVRPRVVERCDEWVRTSMTLAAGEARSLFFRVPPGATQVRVEARETAKRGDSRIAFRSFDVRTREKSGARAAPSELTPGGFTVLHRGVREGTTFEMVVSRPFRTAPEDSTVELGVCFRGLVAGTSTFRIPPGRYASHLNLRAGGDVRGRFEARVEWAVEPVRLTWKSTKDLDGPDLLGEETIFVHEGVGTFDVPAKKPELRFEVRYETPWEDYLDDAVFEIRDLNGRIRQKGLLRFGGFTFRPPHRGRYELVLRNWERGRRFHHGGAIFSPVVMTKVKRQDLKVTHDIYEGIVRGGPSGRRFDLPDGSLSSAIIHRPKGDGAVRGNLRFADEEWKVPLLEIPIVVEAPVPADDPAALAARLDRWLGAEVRHALDAGPPDEKGRALLAKAVEVSRSAETLGARTEAAWLTLEVRRGGEAAAEARKGLDELVARTKKKGGEDHQAALRARVEALVLAPDLEKAEADFKQLRGESEDAHRARFLLTRAKGDAKAALGHLEKLLKAGPPTPTVLRARFDLLLANKKVSEARRLVQAWTEHFPGREGDRLDLVKALEEAEKK